MTRKGRRLTLIASALAVIGVAIGLALFAFRDGVVFFVTPSELAAKTAQMRPDARMRIGGLVQPGSVLKSDDRHVSFAITDNRTEVKVTYAGLLPDLFREGQGVVTQGAFRGDGVFVAKEVLAKHDERYMPKEVADALKKSGQWRGAPDGGQTQ